MGALLHASYTGHWNGGKGRQARSKCVRDKCAGHHRISIARGITTRCIDIAGSVHPVSNIQGKIGRDLHLPPFPPLGGRDSLLTRQMTKLLLLILTRTIRALAVRPLIAKAILPEFHASGARVIAYDALVNYVPRPDDRLCF